jgi:hexosaminidase
MQRIFKILKYLFLGLIGLTAVSIVGLLIYYQSIYHETPLPTDVKYEATINKPEPSNGQPILLPLPKKLSWTNGHFKFTDPLHISAPKENIESIKKILANHLNWKSNSGGNIQFVKTDRLKEQAYHLIITPDQIKIEHSDFSGLFYALTTVKQLATQSNKQLPCVDIWDQPDLKVRGAMLDISRGKVPTLETLYGMVDFLADLKYNQLQLYVEGFSFGYPSFKTLWEKTETPLLPEEIRQLDVYCKDRNIELVPSQNSLGHMGAWLATDQFKDLAECPEGFKLLGLVEMKTTVSPTNPKSIELVKQMSNDLLPNFTSGKFNVNLDEPFELGKCKDRKITNRHDIAKLYLDYANQVNTFVKSEGKKMMMWGDVISRSPEIISEIPKDVTLLEWGYESFHPFNKLCPQYQKAGLHYLVCPGTGSWSSFTGRTDNMISNVENAVSNGIQFGADGMLMTDWGDTPHLQYLTVSYAGFAYAGALSWNYKSKNQIATGSYLSGAVFKDSGNAMGEIVMELGRYNQFEEYPMISFTTTCLAYQFGIIDNTIVDAVNHKMQSGITELLPYDDKLKATLVSNFEHPKVYEFKSILSLTGDMGSKLQQVHLHRPDSATIVDEYKNSIRMIQLGAKLKQYNNYHLQQPDEVNKNLLLEMKSLCTRIITEHQRLWMIRNKRGGLENSYSSFSKLQLQIEDRLNSLGSSGVSRWTKRTLEKIISAAAVVYLN